jgi:hypothetical protein
VSRDVNQLATGSPMLKYSIALRIVGGTEKMEERLRGSGMIRILKSKKPALKFLTRSHFEVQNGLRSPLPLPHLPHVTSLDLEDGVRKIFWNKYIFHYFLNKQ